jgi:SAM-dependent methyltransferase
VAGSVHSHGGQAASAWVRRWSHLVPPGAGVLDVACGSGRHLRWFAQRGARVTGVDRDAAAVAPLGSVAEIVVADIEAGPWPFGARTFDAIVVTNYLWRERLPDLIASIAPGGVLIYETFASGNETVGKPANPKFLLEPGELLRVCAGLRVIAFEDGYEAADDGMPERFVQRIVAARRTPSQTPIPPRFRLVGGTSFTQVKSSDSEDSA